MKWIRSGVFLAMTLAATAQSTPTTRSISGPEATVRTIYVLPMSGGLDLFLAQWLAKGQTLHVTTDPKSADAVLTDHLGEDFEHKLDQLLAKKDKESDKDKDVKAQSSPAHSERYNPGRHRGTVFLVDSKTRQVLWSDYEKPPAYSSSDKLNHEAKSIVKKLSESLGGASQGQHNRG